MIIKATEFPGKEFATKKELFKHLKLNEDKIISLKQATIKNSEGCVFPMAKLGNEISKGIEGLEEGFIYPIINTTNYMDSHSDVHFPKIWNKSIKEQKGEIFYVINHSLQVGSVIAFQEDVKVLVVDIKWNELGKDFSGVTQALMFKTNADDSAPSQAIKIIEDKKPIEHSVRMQYVKLFLAMNSDAKDDKEYKKRYDKHINDIANKEDVENQGYFWGVTEAKIFKEGSMVLFGSNDITPLIYPKSNEPSKDTQIDEPLKNTQKLGRNKVRW